MAHGGALRAAHQLHEQLALFLHAVLIGQLTRRLDRGDRGIGGIEAADLARLRRAEAVEQVGIAHAVFICLAFRRTRDRLADLRLGEGNRIGFEAVRADQRIHQSDRFGLLGRDRIAAHHQRQRRFGADQPGQALGARRAGDQAELDFGQAELRARYGDTVVTGQCDFAAAPQCSAVDRRDHRLVARFHRVERFGQVGPDRRLAEFGDVGAGKEGLPVAADHHRLDGVVRQRFLDRVFQSGADRLTQRVDRRIVGNDDQDIVMAFGADGGGHGVLLRRVFG